MRHHVHDVGEQQHHNRTTERELLQLSFPHRQHNSRRILRRVIDTFSRFLKICIRTQLVIRHELLRVARDQREPGALHLYNDAVAFLEGVHNAGHHIRNLCRYIRPQRLRPFEAVAKARRHRLAAQKHFVTIRREYRSG